MQTNFFLTAISLMCLFGQQVTRGASSDAASVQKSELMANWMIPAFSIEVEGANRSDRRPIRFYFVAALTSECDDMSFTVDLSGSSGDAALQYAGGFNQSIDPHCNCMAVPSSMGGKHGIRHTEKGSGCKVCHKTVEPRIEVELGDGVSEITSIYGIDLCDHSSSSNQFGGIRVLNVPSSLTSIHFILDFADVSCLDPVTVSITNAVSPSHVAQKIAAAFNRVNESCIDQNGGVEATVIGDRVEFPPIADSDPRIRVRLSDHSSGIVIDGLKFVGNRIE